MKRTPLIIGSVAALLIIGLIAAIVFQRKDATWATVQEHVLPQLMPSDYSFKMDTVFQRLTAEVYIGYVIDGETTYDFIMKEQLADWGITEEQLFSRAMSNLETMSEEVEVQISGEGAQKYISMEIPDGYTAVRLLIPRLRQKMAEELGDTYYVAIPMRDFLIAWPEEFAFLENFKAQVEEEYKNAGKYALSPSILKVTPQEITRVTDEE